MKDTIITKDWNEFAVADSFNDNFVEGYISRHSGNDYGSLFIEKVNGDECSQLIYCTPKIAYPFDKSGNWHWPKARVIERYEKLDGTNVFAYRYFDADGYGYLSFKTRLLPFLQQSRFGPFLEMWKEILTKHPVIARLPWLLNMNLSFELWGARNSHLVKYDVPLTTSLLFARNGNTIIPPSQLKHDSINELQAPLRGKVDGDYVSNYKTAQDNLEKGLKEIEDGYAGVEGEVWYLQDVTGQWILFKCLDGRTKILTDRGWRTLSSIVSSNEVIKVSSLSNGKYCWKHITKRYRTPIGERRVVRIGLKHARRVGNGFIGANATEEHQFLTISGWKEAIDITEGDLIYTGELSPNNKQFEVIDGAMLGDATIPRSNRTNGGGLSFSHTNHEYSRFKESALKSLGTQGRLTKRYGIYKYNPNSNDSWDVGIRASIWDKQQRERWYDNNGRKKIPTDIKFTDLTIAVWFMDDGSLVKSWPYRPHVVFATNCFSNEDLLFLSNKLLQRGIPNIIDKQGTIRLRDDATEKLITIIGSYIPPSMRYKVTENAPPFDKDLWDLGEPIPGLDNPIFGNSSIPKYEKSVYCIDVEDTHNFVTRAGVVHNCKPETIEMIHWASGGIGKNVIRATIENAFENWDEPTVEQIRQLLLEEFSEAEVEKSHYRISPLLDKAKFEHVLREKALKAYSGIGISILDDKATVMRALSQQFDKKDMRKVFTAIWNKEIK